MERGLFMNIFDVITLLGGLAMFLYGMRLMGDALKESSSGALKKAMERVTNNPVKAFLLGLMITAVIQSSTATIVITAGLVGAGILTLHQSLGIIVGANVGTTVTGQIIRLLDLNSTGTAWLRFFQPSTLAPIALIIGIVMIMSGGSKSIGNIAIGFGVLFSGLLNMTGAVNDLASSGVIDGMFRSLGENPFLGYLTGAAVAFTLQSSSATIVILQALSASGALAFNAIYAVIVGVYLGDCVTTAIVISIGSKAEPRRVGIMNILYNLCKSALVLIVVTVIHKLGWLDGLWNKTVNSGIIANTNTIFNLGCAAALFPLLKVFESASRKIVKDDKQEEGKYKDKIEALSSAFFNTPALALRSCYDALLTNFRAARDNLEKSFILLERYDKKLHEDILTEEEEIDRITDRVSRYMVELLPHLHEELYVTILDEYYKVTSEFERLGDHAVSIAECAATLAKNNTAFSAKGLRELDILEDSIRLILTNTEQAFEKRDVYAACRIEPQVQVADELITVLKRNHLKRLSRGECNAYADVSFTNLMVELKRVASVCSNVGVATVLRVRPELADHEHLFYESLHSAGNKDFDTEYERVYNLFFPRLEESTPAPEPHANAEEIG